MIGETIANPIDVRIQLPGSLICLSVTSLAGDIVDFTPMAKVSDRAAQVVG